MLQFTVLKIILERLLLVQDKNTGNHIYVICFKYIRIRYKKKLEKQQKNINMIS